MRRCPAGHDYTDANTYVDARGFEHCRTCRRERMRERRKEVPRVGRGSTNRAKTHCPKGHFYDEANTIHRAGKRACRACALLNSRRQRLRRYGITPEQYDALLEAQGNACGLCRDVFGPDEARLPSIDHDHACCPDRMACCGKCVRALLCGNCNTGLGYLRDSPALLRAAADYLEHFSREQVVSG